ncbi:hypothetical protein [Streptomyces sp. NPDC059092]|uniref:hypothetical protein n=1 Tax=Streptomyces sp. NPDC059092 TaxID=3346725 RepID=UPI0036C7D077
MTPSTAAPAAAARVADGWAGYPARVTEGAEEAGADVPSSETVPVPAPPVVSTVAVTVPSAVSLTVSSSSYAWHSSDSGVSR